MQKKETVDRKWYVIDAKNQPSGKVAANALHVLRNIVEASYTLHVNCGDYIIIINAKEVKLTGNKLDNKMYYNHSMYPGGLRERTARVMKEQYPIEMMERAVKGMLPHNRLGRQMYKKLFVYEGETHNQQAQKPVAIELK